MTHSGGKPHTNVGDRGQRYEVRYFNEDGAEKIFGWTDDPTGGAMVESIKLHPSMSRPRVVDRQPGEPIAGMRSHDELQRAHDQLVGIIVRDAPFPDVGLTMRDLNLMASVICWCLRHDHNDQFARHLENIEQDLAARGVELHKGKPS